MYKTSNRILNILKSNLDLLLFFIVLFMKVVEYGKQISPQYFDPEVFTPIFASILILLSFSVLFKGKKRFIYLVVIDIIISIILVSDIVYFRYSEDIISMGVVKNAKLLGGVKDAVYKLIKVQDFLYFVDILIIVPLMRFYYEKIDMKIQSLLVRIIVFFMVFMTGTVVDARTFKKVNVEQPTLLTAMSNKIYLTKLIGNLNFHAVDAYNYAATKIKNSKQLPESKKNEIKSYLKKNTTESPNKFTGVAAGKNLIMIQVEALQQFVINKQINGKEITPNLNKWLNKCMYFDNYFYQVAGGTTADAEFMSLNSFYPAESGAAYYTYAGDTFNSIPKELGDKGYYTAALHGYTEGFWNRNVMYKSEKFDDFFGKSSYNINENVGLGLSDKSFLNQAFDKLKKFKQPYDSFLITLSSHYPYNDVTGYENGMDTLDVGEYKNTLFGDYLEGIHYTDKQLGDFLDKLESSGIADNSVIVLYGDHFAIPKENMNDLYKFTGETNNDDLTWYKYQKVPLMIHFPDNANSGVNHTYAGQMDLYPTIANMFNIKNDYMFGKDIFNNNTDRKVTFRNASFTDGNTFYVSWTNTYYDIKTGSKIKETPELKKKKDDSVKELEYSDELLNHNLLKEWVK
ncbi:LTA synthase family protein [Clostridium hydrogenum]|uniref:LTA synthase family protein n=1 Tax=Clostridium hydrogenum TaxID=2855764 RepID=UPI001F427D57|nr:LTA synthase family protein [Clostridium hydrogenum]